MGLTITEKIDELVIKTQYRYTKLMESKMATIGIFIIACSVILALGITVVGGVSAYCISQGGSVDWTYEITKVWNMGLPSFKFECIRK